MASDTLPVPITRRSGSTAPVSEHPAAVYLAGLAPASRRTMLAALNTMASMLTSDRQDAEMLDWGALRYGHTQALRSELAARYAPSTANKHLAALRGCLRAAWRLGQISAEDAQRASDLPPIRGTRLPAGRALAAGELESLFSACGGTRPADIRDTAILAVLYATGVRRSELVGIDIADYDPAQGSIRVTGKGNRERLVYVSDDAQAAMEAWLDFRGRADGPLITPIHRSGRRQHRRMSDQAIRDVIVKRANQAAVSRTSPHDLRRTTITHLLDAGVDLGTVQKLAGHADISTTTLYDRRGESAKRRAARTLSLPHVTKLIEHQD